jgi:hypothetical protein
MATDDFFGDSITAGFEADTGMSYPRAYSMVHGNSPYQNFGFGGAMTADIPFYIGMSGYPRLAAQRHFYMIGTNDWNSRGNNPPTAADLTLFDMCLGAQITYFAGNIVAAKDHPEWFTGSWVRSDTVTIPPETGTRYSGQALGRETRAHGDVADIPFTGNYVDLIYTVEDLNNSAFAVTVDGVDKGSYPCTPVRSITTAQNRTYSVVLLHLEGFSAGSHDLRVVALVPSGKAVVVDWVSYGPGNNGIPLILLSSPLADITKFPIAPAVIPYNAHKGTLATAAQAKGLTNVSYFDIITAAGVAPPGDMVSDGSHLNARGQLKIGLALPPLPTTTPIPTPTPTPTPTTLPTVPTQPPVNFAMVDQNGAPVQPWAEYLRATDKFLRKLTS